jgi:hypothetical protein
MNYFGRYAGPLNKPLVTARTSDEQSQFHERWLT